MSPRKLFHADPDAPVLTSWQFLGTVIICSFLAGGWATYMTVQMEVIKTQMADIRDDLSAVRQQRAVVKNP